MPSLDLAFHWWSFSLCLSFSKTNISYLEWDFYISVIFASNTLNMAHVVRLQMLIEYNFSVTIIWCPKFIPCTRLRCAYNWAYETNRYYHCLVSVAVVSLLPRRLSSRNLIWRIIHLVRFIVVFQILVIALLWSLLTKENNKNFTVKNFEFDCHDLAVSLVVSCSRIFTN